jgi:hypothetical protein
MPASDDQDDLPLFTDPPPARPVIGYDVITVLRALADAPLNSHDRDVVSHFNRPNRRRLLRRDVLYIAGLAEKYDTARLAASEIPYR